MFQIKFTPKRRLATLVLALASFGAGDLSYAATLAISGQPRTWIAINNSYAFAPTVSGAGTRTVSFQIANKPAWLAFNKLNGRLYGTPTSTNVGKYVGVAISVTAGTSKAYLPSFNITVAIPNKAPTISGTPLKTIVAGSSYAFQPSAADPEGKLLTFSIQGKPAWLTFSATTGRLIGTPGTASVGTFSNIVINVSDGKLSASLPAFAIAVTKPNVAPTLSGIPAISATVGRSYSFKPAASDADGDPLTFSVQNKPAWASFDGATGLLSGTPTTTGMFANIIISVSDGKASASLNPFTVTVAPVVLSSVTLHWIAPTENVDGSLLVNLAGYRVNYGTDPTHMSAQLEMPSPDLTSVRIEELAAGTYYFAVKAYNTDSLESELSEVVWKTIT